MPKRRTEDVIHVSVTDHLIQRAKPTGDLLAERTERRDDYRGEVVPYYPRTLPRTAEGELYLAVAQVKQKSNLKAGIVKLTAAIARYSPQRADWYFELAQALENDGQLAKAGTLPRDELAEVGNPAAPIVEARRGRAGFRALDFAFRARADVA